LVVHHFSAGYASPAFFVAQAMARVLVFVTALTDASEKLVILNHLCLTCFVKNCIFSVFLVNFVIHITDFVGGFFIYCNTFNIN
jgi:hypothetical protein